ncbi:MAG TPA: right-handed parallel beta-helix repeat-containing protein [Polyangia bacterium]
MKLHRIGFGSLWFLLWACQGPYADPIGVSDAGFLGGVAGRGGNAGAGGQVAIGGSGGTGGGGVVDGGGDDAGDATPSSAGGTSSMSAAEPDGGTAADTAGITDGAAAVDTTTSTPIPAQPTDVCGYPFTRKVMVNNPTTLRAALADARAGDMIQLAPSNYIGRFTITHSGTKTAPIVICGPRNAVLDGGTGGYTLYLDGTDWIVVSGIKIANGLKGVVLEAADDNLLSQIEISDSLQQGVLIRSESSRNTVIESYVHDTGLRDPGLGDGIYVGSGGGGDASDYNKLINNRVYNTAAECIDIKEGTKGGVVVGNMLDGAGMKGGTDADSLIDASGNGYMIEKNQGSNPRRHGFEVHSVGGASSSGRSNVFRENTLAVKSSDAVGIYVESAAIDNVVACSNIVTGGLGRCNRPCDN